MGTGARGQGRRWSPPRWRTCRWWLALLALGAILVACVGDDEPEAAPSTTATDPTAATSTQPPASSSTTVPASPIPGGPYYLPSELPDGWELVVLRFFPGDTDGLGTVASSLRAESVSLIVHPAEGGHGGGGANLTVHRFASDEVPVVPDGLGFGERVSLEVPGLVSAELETDEEQTGFGALTGQIDERTTMALIGDLAAQDLIDIAGSVQVGDGDELEVDVELDGWMVAAAGQPGETYILGLRGPQGSIEVVVAPGVAEAAMHVGSSHLEAPLQGDVGAGYHEIQRIESENLEFPGVRWWLPTVQLSSSAGPDVDVIAGILDRFVEVDEAAFRAAVAEVPIEAIEVASEPPSDPSPSGSEPLDPELLARLVDVVETSLGREFDEPPSVSLASGDELRAMAPEGTFVGEDLWDVLFGLGLVDDGDSRTDADAARRERLRGVCCPVTVIDTGDPLFNEVVIVHELTHGLDTDLGSTGSASAELLDPVLALVEGNAHRVAFDYADELNRRGAELPPPPNLFPPEGDPRLPSAVQRVLEFPYREGREFAVAVAKRGGEEGIVDAFRAPPSSTEQIMTPDAYLDGDGPTAVAAPPLPDGASRRQQGTIGAFLLHLVAEPVLGTEEAVDLALAWDGDGYVLYDHEGERCLAATFRFDTVDHGDRAAEVLTATGFEVTEAQRTQQAIRCHPANR